MPSSPSPAPSAIGGIEHTAANLSGIPETQKKDAFERAENRFRVVANKFQAGFDQSLPTPCTWTKSSSA